MIYWLSRDQPIPHDPEHLSHLIDRVDDSPANRESPFARECGGWRRGQDALSATRQIDSVQSHRYLVRSSAVRVLIARPKWGEG
jgi:hypothetical protein